MRQSSRRYLVAPNLMPFYVLYLNLPVFCSHKAMDKSLLHYLDIYVIHEIKLSVTKLTSLQWFMSDWVRNIGVMTLSGKTEIYLLLFYVLLLVLKQEVIVNQVSQPTENDKSQIKKWWKFPRGVKAKRLKTKGRKTRAEPIQRKKL